MRGLWVQVPPGSPRFFTTSFFATSLLCQQRLRYACAHSGFGHGPSRNGTNPAIARASRTESGEIIRSLNLVWRLLEVAQGPQVAPASLVGKAHAHELRKSGVFCAFQ